MNTTLNVTVSKVLWPPQAKETNFYVLLTDLGKMSGKMKWRPEPRERLTLKGNWGAYKGEKNFNFDEARPNIPVNPHDKLRYVCERAQGVGPVLASGIWALKGEQWPTIQAGEVKGFTEVKARAFREALQMVEVESDKSQVIAWLMGKGATVNMATQAFEEWKAEAIGVVQENCFRLAELKNYSFTDVDGTIRENFGIGLDDDRRVASAVLYRLRMLTSTGSTVVDWDALRLSVIELLGKEMQSKVVDAVKGMFEDGSLIGFTESRSVALQKDYADEKSVLDYARCV